ncbi:hypothetical protein LZ554_002500 [Drepanopeziza brunnea f. sp. 'monogermtubi']|nr:hypothetical protein LZ554_002500 [Drepanopeziza brunnea f. sp. 'monogermtubi']
MAGTTPNADRPNTSSIFISDSPDMSMPFAMPPETLVAHSVDNDDIEDVYQYRSCFGPRQPAYHHLPWGVAPSPGLNHGYPPMAYAAMSSDIQDRTFPNFPKLPPELQQKIWNIAIEFQYQEKRFLRVAPDDTKLKRTKQAAEDVQLLIIADIYRRPRLIPSLLHVCAYTRKKARKGYVLWGCADPGTYTKNDAKIYVKPEVDTFFFGDADVEDFWLLKTLIDESRPEDAETDDIARCSLSSQISDIKHFCFDWGLWFCILDTDLLWLVDLDSVNELTVAFRNPNRGTDSLHTEVPHTDYALCSIRPIMPNSVRAECAEIAEMMTQRNFRDSKADLKEMNWSVDGFRFRYASFSMDNEVGHLFGNTVEDEHCLEDLLRVAHGDGLITEQYLDARLKFMSYTPIASSPGQDG